MKKALVLTVAGLIAATSLLAHGSKGGKHARCEEEGTYIIADAQDRTIVRGCLDFGDLGSYRKKFEAPFVWFQKGGSTYLIQNPSWVAQAAAAFEENGPMKAARKEMARRERELAKHEREIERAAEKVEREMDRLDEEDLAAVHASLQAKHRELEEKAKAMEQQARTLEESAEKMERELEAMERTAEKKLDKLFSDAISKGVAKKVN